MTYISKFRQAAGGHHEAQPLWMPATAVRNLILEPMLTWLSLGLGKKYGFEPDADKYLFLDWISLKGHAFEEAWIKKYAPEAFRVTSNDFDVRHADEFRKTLMAMDAGIPVLHKAPLWSAEMQAFGTPDLLFSSEHFYSLFPHLRPSEPEPPHYLVADVKFSGSMEAPEKKLDLRINAAQVRLYSAMIGLIQGYMPPRAFLLTRTYPDLPVAIDVNLSLDAPLDAELRELRDLYQHIRRNGDTLLPWGCEETAPRIGNGRCEPWSGAKKQIIAMLPNRPLEMLPGVGPVKAEAMRAHGYAHLDQLLTMQEKDWRFRQIPGIGPKNDATLQAVLRAHRTGKHSPFPASAIPAPYHCEMYCDFETLSNCNFSCEDDILEMVGCPMIFMCGIWIQAGGHKRYYQFVAPEESPRGERLLLDQLHSFLDNRGMLDVGPGKSARLWHWSPAERASCASAAARHGDRYKWLLQLPWHDMQAVVKKSGVALPGCLGYSLKEFAGALSAYNPNYAIKWPTGLGAGLGAMVAGWKMYEQPEPMKSPEFSLLSDYLKCDVQSMERVLSWMRANGQPERKAIALPNPSGWYTAYRYASTNQPCPVLIP